MAKKEIGRPAQDCGRICKSLLEGIGKHCALKSLKMGLLGNKVVAYINVANLPVANPAVWLRKTMRSDYASALEDFADIKAHAK